MPRPKLLIMFLVPFILALVGCGGAAAAGQGPQVPESVDSGGDQTADTIVTVSHDAAIAAVLASLASGHPGATGVEDPHNPIARLMTLGEYEERYTNGRSAGDPERLVWVVQVKGMSRSTRSLDAEGREWSYAIAVVDAETGYAFAAARRFEPIFLPTPEPFDPAIGSAIPNTRPESNAVEHPYPDLPLPETTLSKGPAEPTP